MLTYYSTWVMLAIFIVALVGLVFTILIVFSYKSEWRSLDIYIISLQLVYLLDLTILLLIPILLSLAVTSWYRQLCSFYAWAWLTLRFAHLLTILLLSFDRIAIFRHSGYKFYGSRDKGLTVATLWIFSCLLGGLPLVGDQWIGMSIFIHEGPAEPICAFLLYEINTGFGIFITVITFAVCIWALANMGDALYNMEAFKSSAYYCLNEARFTSMSTISRSTVHRRLKTVDRFSATLPGDRRSLRSLRSLNPGTVTSPALLPTAQGLETAHDNCRIALIVAAVSFVINHAPFVILTLYGILRQVSSAATREVALWLILLDALVVPNLLWLFNGRYRQGARFVLDVIRCRRSPCRKTAVESPVKLQSYVNTTVLDRSKLESLRLNTLEDIKRLSYGDSPILITLKKHQESLVRSGYISDRDSGSTIRAHSPDSTSQGGTPPLTSQSADVTSINNDAASVSDVRIVVRSKSDDVSNLTRTALANRSSPTKNASAREQWKARMREQHLPAQYVEELERNLRPRVDEEVPHVEVDATGPTDPALSDTEMDTLVIHATAERSDPALEQAQIAWRRSDRGQKANRGSMRSSIDSQDNEREMVNGETGSLSSATTDTILLTVPAITTGNHSPSLRSSSNNSEDLPYSNYSTCSNRGLSHSRSSNPRSDDYYSLASDITPTPSYLSDPEPLATISYTSDARDELTSTSSNAEYLSALDTSSSNSSADVIIGYSNIYF